MYKHSFSHIFKSSRGGGPCCQTAGWKLQKEIRVGAEVSSSPDVWHPTNTNTGLPQPLPSLTPLECQCKLAVSRRLNQNNEREFAAIANANGASDSRSKVCRGRQHTHIDKGRLAGKGRNTGESDCVKAVAISQEKVLLLSQLQILALPGHTQHRTWGQPALSSKNTTRVTYSSFQLSIVTSKKSKEIGKLVQYEKLLIEQKIL